MNFFLFNISLWLFSLSRRSQTLLQPNSIWKVYCESSEWNVFLMLRWLSPEVLKGGHELCRCFKFEFDKFFWNVFESVLEVLILRRESDSEVTLFCVILIGSRFQLMKSRGFLVLKVERGWIQWDFWGLRWRFDYGRPSAWLHRLKLNKKEQIWRFFKRILLLGEMCEFCKVKITYFNG